MNEILCTQSLTCLREYKVRCHLLGEQHWARRLPERLIGPMSMGAMMELDGEIKVLFLHSHIHVLNLDHSFLEQTHPCFAPWREWPAVFSFCSLERHHRIYH